MGEVTWIKLKTKMFDDEKIQLIEAMPEADAILVVWIKLLIQAGKSNTNGYILLSENIPYSPEMLSTIFRRPLQKIRFALKTLKELEMIEVTDSNVICISNWEKHQNIEGLDKVREKNRIRQARYREQKQLKQSENQTNVTLLSHNVTQQNKSKIKNKDTEEIHSQIMNQWNEFAIRFNLTKINSLTNKRITAIKNRLKEKEFNFLAILEMIAKSDFLLGRKGEWKVTFDFIFFNRDNYLKIMEGQYNGGSKSISGKNNESNNFKINSKQTFDSLIN